MAAALLVLAAVSLVSCGGGAETTVNVTLQEFAVLPAQESAPAGTTTFSVENTGPEDVHEFVVIKTDLAPDALPTDGNGVVDEEGEGSLRDGHAFSVHGRVVISKSRRA